MKKISFSLVALLVVVLATASAFKTSNVTLPSEGWYQIQDDETLAKIGSTGPAADQQANYDAAKFEASPVAFSSLSCGSVNANLCAVYFQTNEVNILAPESIYYVAGGRP